MDRSDLNLVTLTVDITTAYLNHNAVSTPELPAVIESIHAALDKARHPAPLDAAPPEPAVPIRASVKPDYLICLEDGKKLKMLKRHLRTRYNLTPQEYRAKWGLPNTYPMIAPSYAAHRASIAQSLQLGRKRSIPASPLNETEIRDEPVTVAPSDVDGIGQPPQIDGEALASEQPNALSATETADR